MAELGFKKPWQGYLLLVVLLIALILGIVQHFSKPNTEDRAFPSPSAILNAETCGVAGGVWNACGSACRATPNVACIDVCVEQCECKKNSECPFGYSCVDKIEGTGICSNSS
ncbi:MAG: hypothetical protein WCT24_04010 [Patescibacteria group bacterium]|jgi:hypothetical protein